MNSLKNSVQLIGRLGKDVDLKTLNSGTSLARVTIATNDYYKNNKGELIEETQWHNVIAWGKLAENMSKVLQKGSEVVVHGKLVHSSYEDKDGNIRYTSEVKISEFLKVSKKEKAAVPF